MGRFYQQTHTDRLDQNREEGNMWIYCMTYIYIYVYLYISSICGSIVHIYRYICIFQVGFFHDF